MPSWSIPSSTSGRCRSSRSCFRRGLALFAALATGVAVYFWQAGPSRIWCWRCFMPPREWLRGHVLTGFPWNLPAYGWGASLGVMQSGALFGAYGLSFLTIAFRSVAGGIARHTTPLSFSRGDDGAVCPACGSAARCGCKPRRRHTLPGVNLRIVQPNIPQDEKYRRELVQRNWQRLHRSHDGADRKVTHRRRSGRKRRRPSCCSDRPTPLIRSPC